MSVKEGEMVYTNPNDFEKHYPWFVKWGYRTSYEVMGLGSDPSVPENAKWGLYAKHMDNMRWTFEPNEGYTELLRMVQDKDYFVLTSNVDGCFERAGFQNDRIYTPQGEWTYYQCLRPCRNDAVFESRPLLDQLGPMLDKTNDGLIPMESVPKCLYCGGRVFGNVRGGSWFLHHAKYEEQNDRLRQWMSNAIESADHGGDDDDDRVGTKKAVAIIEIGAGFNTPMVTRFPVESFTRALAATSGGVVPTLIRINPTDGLVPDDLPAISFQDEGWQVLNKIARAPRIGDDENLLPFILEEQRRLGQTTNGAKQIKQIQQYFGHFDWNRFLLQLKDRLVA